MPSPEAQATAAFPQPSPPGGSLSGTQARAGAGAERGLRADRGIPCSRWAGTGPGGSVSLPGQNGDTGHGHGLPLGPGKCLACLRGSLRFPRGSRGKHPHVCQRAPCPATASALSAAFPRNALPTQTHTNTPIPCAAASRGGVGEKAAASFRAGSRAPEKRFPPTRDSHRAGSPVAVEAVRCRKEAGALLREKGDEPAEEPVRHWSKEPELDIETPL